MRRAHLFACIACVGVLAGCQRQNGTVNAGGNGGQTATKKVYSRADFTKLVVGKTPDEVIAAVGKPDGTSVNGSLTHWWYDWRTMDPVTGKTDFRASVWFGADGKVENVNY